MPSLTLAIARPTVLAQLSTPVLAEATKVWWYVSRSSGIVAWGLAAMAVLWGLALSTRALGAKPRAPWLLDVHRFIGGLTVVFVVVHVVSLMFDPFVSFDLTEILVPMAASWEPAAVAWGVVAFYLLLAVELTSLLKSRLPKGLWRGVHLSSYALYGMATVHLLLAGSDRTNPILWGTVLASVAAVVFFSIYRLVGPGRAASVRAAKLARVAAGTDAGTQPRPPAEADASTDPQNGSDTPRTALSERAARLAELRSRSA